MIYRRSFVSGRPLRRVKRSNPFVNLRGHRNTWKKFFGWKYALTFDGWEFAW